MCTKGEKKKKVNKTKGELSQEGGSPGRSDLGSMRKASWTSDVGAEKSVKGGTPRGETRSRIDFQ